VQVGNVIRVFVLLALLGIHMLLDKLILNSVELPVNLGLVSLVHIHDDLLSFLGAKVRLVVLFVNVFLSSALLGVPVHLNAQVVLVLLLITDALLVGFARLGLTMLNVLDELRFLLFTELLKPDELLLVPSQGLQGSLIDNGHGASFLVDWDVSQGVVVHGEGAIALKEDGHVGVVARTDSLAVEGLLDGALQVPLGVGILG